MLLSALSFSSFGKIIDPCIADANGNCIPPPPAEEPVVYATGFLVDANGVGYPKVWADGVEIALPHQGSSAYANSIFVAPRTVSGLVNDVYVTGNTYKNNKPVATVWKNGTVIREYPSVGRGTQAYGIFASAGSYYVAGTDDYNKAKLWKNASVLNNLDASFNESSARSIFVQNGVTYVAGSVTGAPYASIWRNGIRHNLSSSNASVANSVFVDGSNMYAAGFYEPPINQNIHEKAAYWKKPIGSSPATPALTIDLPSNFSRAHANSIFVLNGDVYVCGWEQDYASITSTYTPNTIAKLWVNGVGVALTDGTTSAAAGSVYVYGTDIYVGGYRHVAPNSAAVEPVLWKNGVEIPYGGSGNGAITSVFVK
jgi:hypothetical protein